MILELVVEIDTKYTLWSLAWQRDSINFASSKYKNQGETGL
jgi:hypothetical protein